MTMNTKEFKNLKDFLMRAAATDSEPEMVQCFKRATLLLATHGYTWAQAMDKRVTVVNEVEADPHDAEVQSHTTPHDDLDRLFEDAMAGASGSFLETLESIHSQYEELG